VAFSNSLLLAAVGIQLGIVSFLFGGEREPKSVVGDEPSARG